jgi:hypothetical protein
MQRSFMLSTSAVMMIYAVSATAEPRHLKGTFGFTGSDACLYSPAGFNARLQPLGPNWSSSNAVEGIRTFNGNGTGTVQNASMGITVPPTPGFPPSASSSKGSLSFTFTVNPDGTFTTNNVPGTNVGTILTGPRSGQTFTLENVPAGTGLISDNGKTLVAATLTPGVETQVFSNGDIEHRICHRSRVYTKLDTDDDR